ncbi:MAG: D-alanyl-D-alanine carboxypeptidase, partial [Azoarcus sp.]|nr:D-alanyl-D-alanine carboxypeptidase [Azoarcus sp.]
MPFSALRSATRLFVPLIALACAILPGMADGASPAEIPAAVQTELDRVHIPANAVAIWVQGVDAKQPTLSINAHQPMNPASVMKIVTTFAALEHYGPAHIWSTRFAAASPIQNGVLNGDLYLIGDGDPVLSHERV